MNNLSNKARLMRIATWASVTVALIIVGVKFFGWVKTDSLAILSSLIDALIDVLATVVNFIAVRYALQPPDDEHRFGHGKAEDIAALAQTAFIIGSALFICIEAVGRFVSPTVIEHTETGMVLMAISTVIVIGLVAFQKLVVYKTGSRVIESDSVHYLSDILANLAVIISLYLTKEFQIFWLDPLLGILVAVYIAMSALRIGRKAFDNLMDREFPDEAREQIKKIAESHKGIKGMHKLKTRNSGIHSFIQMHVEIDGNLSLNKAHKIADGLERKLEQEFPGSEVIVHQDPV